MSRALRTLRDQAVEEYVGGPRESVSRAEWSRGLVAIRKANPGLIDACAREESRAQATGDAADEPDHIARSAGLDVDPVQVVIGLSQIANSVTSAAASLRALLAAPSSATLSGDQRRAIEGAIHTLETVGED